jgi:hypothetical protein
MWLAGKPRRRMGVVARPSDITHMFGVSGKLGPDAYRRILDAGAWTRVEQ